MSAPQTQSLELLLLFGGAAFAALAGVAFLRAGLDRSRAAPTARGRWGELGKAFLRPAGGTVLLLGIVGVAFLGITSPLGPRTELLISLLAGGIAGLLVGLLGVTIDCRLQERSAEAPDQSLSARERRVALFAGVALSSASVSVASLLFVGLYLLDAGHIPSLTSAVLGAALAWAAFALLDRPSVAPASGEGEPARRAAARGVGFYALLLAAPTAASLTAFVPSLVRGFEPNAVLFPMAAELVLAAVGLIALATIPLYRAGGTGTDLHLPLIASAAFASVACLALDAAFLGQNPGMFLALLVGPWLLFGTIELVAALHRRAGRSRSAATSAWLPSVESGLLGGLLVLGVGAAYLAANWTSSIGSRGLDPSLGGYGVGLVLVAMVGISAPFLSIEFRALTPRPMEAAATRGAERPVLEGLERARLLTGAGVVLSLTAASFGLTPYLLGLPPSSFASRLAPTGLPAALGFLLGVALLYAIVRDRSGDAGDPTALRRLLRFALPTALAVLGSALVAGTLGAPGLFYLVLGTLAATLSAGPFALSPARGIGPRLRRLPTEMIPLLVAAASLAIGGMFVAHAWWGSI